MKSDPHRNNNGGGLDLQTSSILVQSLNPMSGKSEWKMQPEDYDYQQELARAAFADMLHDSERVKLEGKNNIF